MTRTPKDKWLIPLSFFAIYFLWGANYLANYHAIQSIPPILMSSARFGIAGLILFVWMKSVGAPNPTKNQWKNAIIAGFLFLVLGTAALIWTLQFVDTGIASLIVSLEPLIIVLFLWKMRNQKPKAQSWAGIALGILGMGVLVWQDQFLTDDMTLIGILIILVTLIFWGYATLFVGDRDMPESKGLSSAIQMLSGSFFCVIISLLIEDYTGFHIRKITGYSWAGLSFAVICGSLIAFSAFNYLLVKVSPEKVATSTYVNPIIAMFIGAVFNDEIITNQSFLAAIIMLIGVVAIVSKKD